MKSRRYDRSTAKERWTVKEMREYGDFCGWDMLEDLIGAVEVGMRGPVDEILIHDEREQKEARSIIATTFLTGARIGSVLGQEEEDGVTGLQIKDITLNGDVVAVDIELEKRYDKLAERIRYKSVDPDVKMVWDNKEKAEASGVEYEEYEGYTTRRKDEKCTRTFSALEPLTTKYLLKWRNRLKEEMEEKLSKIIKDEDELREKVNKTKLFGMKYNRFYRTIKKAGEKIGEDFPPHRLRAERATQLVLEYGLSDSTLTSWFKWRDSEMARRYTTLKPKVEKKMIKGAKRKFGT